MTAAPIEQFIRHLSDDREATPDAQLVRRFASLRDEAAFEALVRRHGPMVLGVCRRLLRHAQDVEDAFQAAFLVLARKAPSLARPERVGSWLYGVAYRTALEARAVAHRRRQKERPMSEAPEPAQPEPAIDFDLLSLLDREVMRLPEKFRVPVVLCDLEGRSRGEVARLLGVPQGTLSGRLTTARRMLAKRLMCLSPALAAASVPAPLVRATVQAAALFAGGPAGPARAVALAARAMKATLLSRLRAGGLALLLACAALLAHHALVARSAAPAPLGPAARPAPAGPLRLGSALLRHQDALRGLAFSGDGMVLATAGEDHTLRLWDVASGRELRRVDTGPWPPLTLSLSHDGKVVAAAGGFARPGGGPEVGLGAWDTATGKPLLRVAGLPWRGAPSIHSVGVALSPDGKALAAGLESRTIRLWDVRTGRPLPGLASPGEEVTQVAFTRDGKTLAARDRARAHLLDPTGRRAARSFSGHKGGLLSFALSADGRLLATSGNDDLVRLFELATGKELPPLRLLLRGAGALALTRDGTTLATSGCGRVTVWDVRTGKELRRVAQGRTDFGHLAFSPNGKTLATGRDAVVRLWDVSTGAERALAAPGHLAAVRAVAFSPDGRALASAGEDDTVRLWSAQTGKQLRALHGHEAWVVGLAFSPDGRALASADFRGGVRLWDRATGVALRRLPGLGSVGRNRSLAFARGGKELAGVGGVDARLVGWEIGSGKLLFRRDVRLGQAREFVEVEWSPHQLLGSSAFTSDGKTVALGDNEAVTLLDVSTGKELRKLEGLDWVGRVALSPDGRALAVGVGARRGALLLCDTATGRERHRIGGLGAMTALAFTADGRFVAAAAGWMRGSTVHVWDVATGREVFRSRGHGATVFSLAFSPDGRRLAAALRDTTILVWDWSGPARGRRGKS